MQISREFNGDEYKISTTEICSFWEKRGYVFYKKNEHTCKGKRGHIVHNLFTINMSKLATSIVIDLSGECLKIEVDVNTFGTIMTHSEGALWNIEFEMFESFLKNETIDTDLMKQYSKHKNRVIISVYTIAIIVSLIIGFIVGSFLF